MKAVILAGGLDSRISYIFDVIFVRLCFQSGSTTSYAA